MLDSREARRSYPGDNYIIPFGRANIIKKGTDLTIVTWGEMVHRTIEAIEGLSINVELIDLRTISPWDKETVIESVKKTNRCIVIHEDNMTCGFGAEIVAELMKECFKFLDSPIERLTTFDCPIPYNPELMQAVTPTVNSIKKIIDKVINY